MPYCWLHSCFVLTLHAKYTETPMFSKMYELGRKRVVDNSVDAEDRHASLEGFRYHVGAP
jgi:hypothetical protein